tara:strand:- start:897 stop:1196 length:300 start_codon:yes stop_codon:yes gene_type:complete
MNLNDITEKIRKLSNENSGSIEAKIKFDFSDGCVIINDTVSPPDVSNNNEDADCTITVSNEDFEKILNKEMSSMNAFMSGKMKISGEMHLAMKLSSIFG